MKKCDVCDELTSPTQTKYAQEINSNGPTAKLVELVLQTKCVCDKCYAVFIFELIEQYECLKNNIAARAERIKAHAGQFTNTATPKH